MRTLISFAALFISVVFVQLGSGSLGPLDALSGAAAGFSDAQIGLLGSAHFLGFFIGCWATPRLMSSVGHSRAFAAIAAIGAIGAVLHPVFVGPTAWALLRIGTGIAVAGAYTVIESWLQAKADNANRGRIYGIFRLVDMSGSLGAQLMIAVLDPASYVSYNIVAALCCLCLVPMALTRRKAPPTPSAPKLRPWRVFNLSPLAAIGATMVGATNSAFRMVGPVYGAQMGLSPSHIGLFLAAAVLGGALSQPPVGWLADRYDRRWVMLGVAGTAMVVCIWLAAGPALRDDALLAGAFVFGFSSMSLYSVITAYANDYAPPDFVVELNASLMFLYAVGAIASPVFTAKLIGAYGPSAMFVYLAICYLMLILFGVWRMTRRAAPAAKAPYRYIPRTSFILARLLRKRAPKPRED